MKIAIVVGTRPQLIKLAVLSAALERKGLPFFVVHTGQHYDFELSSEIIEELQIGHIAYNLEVGSNPWETQIELGVRRLVPVLQQEHATHVVVIGDSNPAIVGANAAEELSLPIIHCESGLRNYEQNSLEETNRRTIDGSAQLHFCSTEENFLTVSRECSDAAVCTGDLLVDAFYEFGHLSKVPKALPEAVRGRRFLLLTMHRDENTRDQDKLARIIHSILMSCDDVVIWPIHPKLRCFASHVSANIDSGLTKKLILIPSASYQELNYIKSHANLIITDSVGLQVESYLWRIPCIAVRDHVEHRKLNDVGATIAISPVDAATPSLRKIIQAARDIDWNKVPPHLFGRPGVADQMVEYIDRFVRGDVTRNRIGERFIELAAKFAEFGLNRRLEREFFDA